MPESTSPSNHSAHLSPGEARTPQWHLEREGLNLDGITSAEVVAMDRIHQTVGLWTVDTRWEADESGIDERLNYTLQYLPHVDLERAVAIYTAFADSPLPENRAQLGSILEDLSTASREAALPLWDRTLRDEDRSVREAVERRLDLHVYECQVDESSRVDGLRAIPHLDRAKLARRCGLTPEDVHDLYVSYAYAENGMDLFDLGRAAVSKLVPPTNLIPPSGSDATT